MKITLGAFKSTDVWPNAKSTDSNMIPKEQQPELKTTVLLPRKMKSIDK